MLKQIVKHTNKRARRNLKKKSKNTNKWIPVDLCAIKGIAGVLYFVGVYRCQHKSLRSLWSPGPPERVIFSASFDRNRFVQLIAILHFISREDRNTDNKFPPFRRMWEQFIENNRKHHAVGAYVTVYEQLNAISRSL